jgi:hypothetical protein
LLQQERSEREREGRDARLWQLGVHKLHHHQVKQEWAAIVTWRGSGERGSFAGKGRGGRGSFADRGRGRQCSAPRDVGSSGEKGGGGWQWLALGRREGQVMTAGTGEKGGAGGTVDIGSSVVGQWQGRS